MIRIWNTTSVEGNALAKGVSDALAALAGLHVEWLRSSHEHRERREHCHKKNTHFSR